MTEKPNGGAAFPCGRTMSDNGFTVERYEEGGMSLRDYFAGQALLGLVPIVGIPEDGPDELWDADLAKRAFSIADAMIEQRSE